MEAAFLVSNLASRGLRRSLPSHTGRLFFKSQASHNASIFLHVRLLKVLEVASAVSDHLEKAPARVFVLQMILQMDRQFVDLLGQKSHLDGRGTCIRVMFLKRLYSPCFLGFRKHGWHYTTALLILQWIYLARCLY